MRKTEAQIRAEYAQLTKKLIEKKMTITTMESCTSGQIASLITDTEGASAVLKGAFVTYSNEAKIMQGVPAEVIDKYSVYSKETAIEMARACAETYHANIGIGVTGSIGRQDPANAESSVVGEVFFALSINGKIQDYRISVSQSGSRLECKLAIAGEVFEALWPVVNA